MKIAITGATGQLGRLVINKLKQKVAAERIVGLVRSVGKAEDLGIKVREANYDEPATLDQSLQGIDTLLLISSSEVGKRASQHKNVIEAAKKNGVKRIVYTSLLRADNSSLSLATEHIATEAFLKEAGIPFTVLRNGWYNENYAGTIPGAVAGGAIIGSAGEGKISAASRADFAEAAVVVLINEGHAGKIYELAGDESFTMSELAAEVSRQLGKSIVYNNLPEADYAGALASYGLPEGLAQAIAGWDISVSKGDVFDESRQLSKLIGRPTTPISVTVAEILKGA